MTEYYYILHRSSVSFAGLLCADAFSHSFSLSLTPSLSITLSMQSDTDKEVVVVKKPIHKPQPVLFGDGDFEFEPDLEDLADATWGDVYTACCVHDAEEWGWIAFGIFGVAVFLYFFMVSLDMMGSSAKVLTGCSAAGLFGDDANPISALMIGLLSTAMLHSSSTTTSIIVSLVGNGITLEQGIYMMMGANIGTTVTNAMVAVGQIGDADQLERAFAGATVHDIYNYMSVVIMLPLELATGFLRRTSGAMVKNASSKEGSGETTWEGPIKKYVSPIGERVIKSNSKLILAVGDGSGTCEDGGGFYPILCEPGEPTYAKCKQVGLISCSKKSGLCPAFFQADASANDDQVSGGVIMFLSICMLFVCLLALVFVLNKLMMGLSIRVIYKATNVNGYLSIVLGTGLTMLVQSSSVVTSVLTPLVGIGAITIEQMYPLTLGANLGTCITALMASMVTEGVLGLQVALCHLIFNVVGIILFYPVPITRVPIIYPAKQLGKMTRLWRGFPIAFIIVSFFIFPVILLGISYLITAEAMGLVVIGVLVVIAVALSGVYFAYWWYKQDGKQKTLDNFARRERKRVTMEGLPDNMEFLMTKVSALIDHTGLPEEEEEEDKEEQTEKKVDNNSSEDEEVEA